MIVDSRQFWLLSRYDNEGLAIVKPSWHNTDRNQDGQETWLGSASRDTQELNYG